MPSQEIRRALIEVALGLKDALAADAALDRGDKRQYEELNARARKRVDRVLVQLGEQAGPIAHLIEG